MENDNDVCRHCGGHDPLAAVSVDDIRRKAIKGRMKNLRERMIIRRLMSDLEEL